MFLRIALAFGVAFLVPVGRSEAQCFTGPDGLNGPCCNLVPANLPPFPSISLPSTSICWNNCAPTQFCSRVTWTTPVPVACGQYSSTLSVVDCGGAPLLAGVLRLDYTRTWEESTIPAPGRRMQVYRMLAKIDALRAGAVTTCLVPTCLATEPTAFYYGYVDYAVDCATGSWEASLVLFHACDRFIHHPFSTRPGIFHPGTSYAVVAPHTTAIPFVPSIAPPPAAPLVAEGLRDAPFGGACLTEDPLGGGAMSLLGAGCLCPFSFTPPQLSGRTFSGSGTCPGPSGAPSSFLSVNSTPAFPWFHMMTTSIGAWTPSSNYPGDEVVWVDEVPLLFKDSCDPNTGLDRNFGEVYYGASTSKGFAVQSIPGTILTQDFADLASNVSWKIPGPPPATFMGSVVPTRNLIYVNL